MIRFCYARGLWPCRGPRISAWDAAGAPRPVLQRPHLPPRLSMDVALLFFLIVLNAAFAMSEMALTASRKARLQVMLEAGERGAEAAIDLHDHPDQVPVDGAGGHHVDQRAQRHRRRRRVLRAAGRVAARHLRPERAPGARDGHRAGGADHHGGDDHLRRAGAQAHRPDVSRDGGRLARAADAVAVDGHASAGGAAVQDHRGHPAACWASAATPSAR